MIGQMTGVTPLTGAERQQRSSVSEGASSPGNDLSGSLQAGVDTTSLSPAALAMVKKVPPAGESAEMRVTGPDETENMVKKSLEKRIDIRV